MIEPLTPRELAARLRSGERLVLLDVREARELALARLPGSFHVPLGDLERRHGELDREAAIVCVCHHGIRSAQAAALLQARGFESLFNLSGGIDRWAEEVEPGMRRY
jgi:rhodanese-related sulfurtransferase